MKKISKVEKTRLYYGIIVAVIYLVISFLWIAPQNHGRFFSWPVLWATALVALVGGTIIDRWYHQKEK
ncbi:hypothetical protein H9L01_10635 [Erysipelothrix inopinata]|uniref:2TM domain-containing protein n=1 Tax=Erysipelothrix inopinata TaxID=225084 RepID=A0A7G9RYX7_9FIRM|nr:hypothetical protein [Erysipelothrix inopinata]QNN60802.1 hypothetical protein H9L01_10635 [Erysipelothrix inopinata]